MNNQKDRPVKMLSKQFDKIFLEIKSDINNKKKTLNFLSKDYKFNFKVEDLRQFKKFKSVALIGMGGSILGAEAIYSFIFLIILTKTNCQILKKKIYQKFFL